MTLLLGGTGPLLPGKELGSGASATSWSLGWQDVEEGLQCEALMQLVTHRLLSYISAASSTYLGHRVAFVLCSVWLGASTNHSYCVVTYSSCREGKVLL